jgi:branched-subunit amino acid transport protein
MKVWLVIFLGGALTFATRFSFIGLFARRSMPSWAADVLRLVPVAALSALIAADLAAPQPTASLTSARWGAAAIAIALAWATKSVGWAVVGGMTAFIALRLW